MPRESAISLPLWLLAADLSAMALLALGLLTRFAPGLAASFGLPAALAWPLIVVGALGVIACGVALVQHLRSHATHPSA